MATYYAINGGGNWATAGTWSTVSNKNAGRVGGVVVPTNADTCILDDYSGSVTINTASCNCKIIDCVTNGNYAGTLTFTAGQNLTVANGGSCALSTTMTLAGTGKITFDGTLSITTNGKVFTGAVQFQSTGTKTLVDNLTVTGIFYTVAGAQTINKTGAGAGDVLTVSGGLVLTSITLGTTKILCKGGTVSMSNAQFIANDFSLEGNITFSGVIGFKTGTLKYISGSISHSSSTLTILGSCTLDTTGMSWSAIYVGASSTITLSSDLVSASLIRFGWYTPTLAGSGNITCDSLIIDNYYPATLIVYLLAGKNITVQTALTIMSASFINNIRIYSSSSNTMANIIYNGTIDNFKCCGARFTDIAFSGTSALYDNWYGDTLLRTSGIRNITSQNTAGAFGII